MMREDREQADKIVVRVDSELVEFIPEYLESRRNDIRSVLAALAVGDFETIRILGHTMKGSGGGYGFEGISEIGGCLEETAKARNAEGIRRCVDQLIAYLERVEVVYQ